MKSVGGGGGGRLYGDWWWGGAFIDTNLFAPRGLRTAAKRRRAEINHFTSSPGAPYVNRGGGPPSPLPHCNFPSIFDYTLLAAAIAAQFHFAM